MGTANASDLDAECLRIYEALKRLLAREDLPPSVRANAQQALSGMWQVVNDLGVAYEMLYDYGV